MTTSTFRWEDAGEDGGGLPAHFPMEVTRDGQGPASKSEAHHMVCWCGQATCALNQSLHDAWELGLRAAGRDR